MFAPSPRAPAPLTDIAQVTANLPGILGFYPQDSVLAVVLTYTENHQYTLGPVIRVDLPNTAHLVTILSDMIEPTDICLILIVSEDQEAVDQALETVITDVGHLVEGVWHCREIEEGEILTLLHGEVIPTQWQESIIPAIHQAIATRDILHRGGLLSQDREEAHAAYRQAPLPAGQRQALETAVEAVDARLDAIRDTEQGEIQSLIAELRAGLAETPVGTTHRDVEPGVRALVCGLLSADDLDHRDLCLGEIIRCPEAGATLAHAVGVYGPDTLTRVTGLTAHALAVMAAGGPRQAAQAALTVAREEAPLHMLTALIHGAVASGAEPEHIVASVMSGVEILRDRYGIDAD